MCEKCSFYKRYNTYLIKWTGTQANNDIIALRITRANKSRKSDTILQVLAAPVNDDEKVLLSATIEYCPFCGEKL